MCPDRRCIPVQSGVSRLTRPAASDEQPRCEYVSRLGVFKNNEHVIATTIIDLTKAFFGGGGVGGSGGDRGPTGGEQSNKNPQSSYVL